jgi:hypothetical protein
MSKFEDQKFIDQLEVSSTITREGGSNEASEVAMMKLAGAAKLLNPYPGDPKTVNYMGSIAVHIYVAPMTEQLFFASQTRLLTLNNCPELLAGKAITDLRGAALEAYGHTRQTKRSGF